MRYFQLTAARFKTSVLGQALITHDMGVVVEMAERMIVMYAGRKIEEGLVDEVLGHATHPHTHGLTSCVPHQLASIEEERHPLLEVPGVVPPLTQFGQNWCLFADRCSHSTYQCLNERPVEEKRQGGTVCCWHAVVGESKR